MSWCRINASGQSYGDLLEQPAVAVRVAERGERDVTASGRIASAERWLSGTGTVEYVTYADTATDELSTRGLDAGHDEIGLADQPAHRFEFTFTPKHGSWLNLIEGFFSKLARSVLRHIRVGSKQELKDRLLAAMDHFNQHPVVHTWTYKLDKAA